MIVLVIEGRPLYDNAVDRRLYVVPDEWDTLMRAIERRNNVLVSGPRGWGKTSLLRQAQLTLRNQGERVAFVDASAVDDALELLLRARLALTGAPSAPQRLRGQVEAVGAVFAGDASPPAAGASYALMNEIRAIEGLEETTLLVDASHSAGAVYSLFGRLRDVIWQLPHRWVVAVDEDDEASALKPPADAFFDFVLRLKPWSIERLLKLLTTRIEQNELDAAALQDIAAASGGNARRALRAANEALVTGRPAPASLTARAQLLSKAADLGRPHGILMAELLDLGQASPSDARLLERLGLTRARVTTLLRELLEHELVETAPDMTRGTAGRPRTIYRPRLEGGRE